MPKLTKDLYAVWPGEVYPRVIPAGEECPPELEDAAEEADALEADAPRAKRAPSNKAAAPGETK